MNKKPVFVVISALAAIAIVIAVGIFTKIRLGSESAIAESNDGVEQTAAHSQPDMAPGSDEETEVSAQPGSEEQPPASAGH
jgi:hypothetical protein